MTGFYGGKANADRIARICERAHRALAIGFAILDREPLPCECRYPDGKPRYVGNDGRLRHVCGR